MPALRNRLTGVVVIVDDDTATRLGAHYEPADKPAQKPPVTKPAVSRRAGK